MEVKKRQGFYQTERVYKAKKSRLKIKIYGGVFFCLAAGLVYFLIFWPGLWVEKIEIEGLKNGLNSIFLKEAAQNILDRRFLGIFPLRSAVLMPAVQIQAAILETFPEIAAVEIERNWLFWKGERKILKIKIQEREAVGVWCADLSEAEKQCFYIDQEGIIYRDSPVMDGSLILTINDLRKTTVRLKEQAVSKELINFILTVEKELPEISGLRVANFIINSPQDLRAVTSYGWQIYFNPREPAERQLAVLKRVLEEEIKENRTNLEYLDLRVGGRGYYK